MSDRGTIERREFLKRGALTSTAVAGMGLLGLEGLTQPALAATPNVAGTVKWGALCLPPAGLSQESGVAALEHHVGRRLDTTHYRMPWTSPLVNRFTKWSHQTHHTPILSWFARTSKGLVSWQGIAQGHQDAWITQQARSLKASGWEGYFCFHKEPEDEGTPENWKAAYRRVHQIFNNVGVTKMKWVVCLMASTYAAGRAGLWLPGEFAMLGVDGYNRYNCFHTKWRSFEEIFTPAHNFAAAHHRKLYIVESGCVEGEPGRKAEWLRNARAQLKRWPNVAGISYNNENTDCSYYVTSTASSLAAYRAMGQDSYFL